MRGLTAFLLGLCASFGPAHFEDLSPINCAWAQLSEEEQADLRGIFAAGEGHLEYPVLASDLVNRIGPACKLSFTQEQNQQLAEAVGAKAGEEQARLSLAKRGVVDDSMIDRALAEMTPERRIVIGDVLSCGSVQIEREWDRSVRKGMTRAGLRTVDGVSVALISIAMYSVFAQEGHVRRIRGVPTEPCPSG